MSNTPFVKTIFFPSRRARSANATASLLITEFYAATKCPRVIRAVNAYIANLRLHAESIEKAVVVVGIAVGLMRRQVETIRSFDEIELVDSEGHHGVAFDFGGLEFLEVGISPVDADVVGVEEAQPKDEVGDFLFSGHLQADLDRIAALEDVASLVTGTGDGDVRYLNLSRSPTALA